MTTREPWKDSNTRPGRGRGRKRLRCPECGRTVDYANGLGWYHVADGSPAKAPYIQPPLFR